MPSYRPPQIVSSEITPEALFFNRRTFLGAAAGGGMLLAGSGTGLAAALGAPKSKYTVDEDLTPEADVTSYNNFHEFGTGKGDPAANSNSFKATPWTVKVDGL